MRISLLAFVFAFGTPLAFAGGFSYDDCVTTAAKEARTNAGLLIMMQSCRNRAENARAVEVSEKYGSILAPQGYAVDATRLGVAPDGGFYVDLFNPGEKLITYLELVIKDGDFYDFKEPKAESPGLDEMGLPRAPPFVNPFAKDEWEKERTHYFRYEPDLKPGRHVRLRFPAPRTKRVYVETSVAYGRDAGVLDAVNLRSSGSVEPIGYRIEHPQPSPGPQMAGGAYDDVTERGIRDMCGQVRQIAVVTFRDRNGGMGKLEALRRIPLNLGEEQMEFRKALIEIAYRPGGPPVLDVSREADGAYQGCVDGMHSPSTAGRAPTAPPRP